MTDLLNIPDETDIEVVLLDRVDTIIEQAIASDNPFHAAKQMQDLLSVQQLAGKTLAKFLFVMKNAWGMFSLSKQESFNEFITGSLTLADNTRNTYINYWKYKSELPESFSDRPLRDILPVTTALSQGYDIDDETWEELDRTVNVSEVAKVVREDVKGKPPRKGSQQLYLHEETGDVVSWKNNKRSAVGFFDVYSTDPDVISAIERIVKSAGLIRK